MDLTKMMPLQQLFNITASNGHCNSKKDPSYRSPQPFLTHFQKAMHALKLLNNCYKKELYDGKAKILFFIHFRIIISRIMFTLQIVILMLRHWKPSRI